MLWLCTLLLAAAPLDVADQKQLFIDHRFIADSDRVELRTNQAQKLGLLLDETGKTLQGHVSRVIDDAGTVRLYLGADSVDVFESTDALHFKNSGKRIGSGGFTTIFLDEHDPDPARRYKAFHLERLWLC